MLQGQFVDVADRIQADGIQNCSLQIKCCPTTMGVDGDFQRRCKQSTGAAYIMRGKASAPHRLTHHFDFIDRYRRGEVCKEGGAHLLEIGFLQFCHFLVDSIQRNNNAFGCDRQPNILDWEVTLLGDSIA